MKTSVSSEKPLKTLVIIPAAGRGVRMGGENKLLLPLLGAPILLRSIRAFQDSPLITAITLAVSDDTAEFCKNHIQDRPEFTKVKKLVPGGPTRQDSVYNALKKTTLYYDIILVHDGARPLVTSSIITAAIKQAACHGAAVPVVEVKDTIKEVSEGVIKNTPLRSSLRAVQTPQAFKSDLLMGAFEAAVKENFTGTDEASLLERIAIPVCTFAGSYENIKITTPEDMLIAESILQRRASEKDSPDKSTAAAPEKDKKG
ncbi:MAG: 2-C-methyl-D-erythritol 4-phosphate cytidylyltransferase [Thermodesulfobacteriota bacterium]